MTSAIFMGNTVHQLINLTLVMSCFIMALLFLVLPVPFRAGLKNYRISLRTLAGAYITLAIFILIMVIYDLPDDEFFSAINLLMASLQAILFSFTLITLFNPRIINRHYLLKHLLPVLFFVILFGISCVLWGNPELRNMQELALYVWHPTILLRELFVVFYIAQLVYFTRLFHKQAHEYEQRLDNFFADSFRLRLVWVVFCFYAALAIGLLALFSLFISFEAWDNFVTVIFVLFYLTFGLCYIQYPQTFIDVSAVFENQLIPANDNFSGRIPSTWKNLKQQLLDKRYHVRPGITIEEMAQFLKISRTTLSGLINKEEGMNFYMWINILRIEEAQQLLIENPGFTIATVSEMVGFSEHSNFSRQFKLVAKTSPSEWRQQRKA